MKYHVRNKKLKLNLNLNFQFWNKDLWICYCAWSNQRTPFVVIWLRRTLIPNALKCGSDIVPVQSKMKKDVPGKLLSYTIILLSWAIKDNTFFCWKNKVPRPFRNHPSCHEIFNVGIFEVCGVKKLLKIKPDPRKKKPILTACLNLGME